MRLLKFKKSIIVGGILLVFVGCASNSYSVNSNYEFTERGLVTRVTHGIINNNSELGTLIGGSVGAYIGNSFGSGTGKVITTGVGAVFGGWIGNKIGEREGGVVEFTTSSNRVYRASLSNSKLPKMLRSGDEIVVYFYNGKIVRVERLKKIAKLGKLSI